MNTLSIALFLAGLIGSALHAWATNSQTTWSKKSIIDVVIGGAVAALVPYYAPSLLPSGQPIFVQACTMGLISYFSSDFVQNILGKAGIVLQGSKP